MGWSINFAGGAPAWLAFVVAAAAAGVCLFSYFAARNAASRAHMIFLTTLRLFGLALVLVLAFRPLVTCRTVDRRRALYSIAVDASRSMSISDHPNLPSRLETVTEAIAPGGETASVLSESFRLELHRFDSALRGKVALADVGEIAPGGDATALGESLGAIAARGESEGAEGIILFSDGVDTEDGEYTGSVPIIAVGVGSTLRADGEFRDVVLERVEVLPDGEPVVSRGRMARLAANVEAFGCGGSVATVALKDSSGKTISEENITLDSERGPQRVILSFTPEEKGNFKYTVEATPQPMETIAENNSRNLNITVTEPEIHVLYLEGTLRYEYRHLKRVLEKDGDLSFLALVRLKENTFYQQGNADDVALEGFPKDLDTLKRFDVIIVGDMDSTGFSPSDMDNLRRAVYEGAGFMMLGGYNSFSPGYRSTPIEEILPVEVDPAGGQDRNAFVPRLTPQGELSPVFAGIVETFPGPGRAASESLPDLLGQVRIGRAKPGATILAENPLRNDANGPLPVLVVQNFGAGRTAAFAADTTWRWYAPMKGRGLESPYVRFWGQLIRWLARRDTEDEAGEPGIEAWVDKAFYALGDEVEITAKVRGAEGLLCDKATVEAAVSGGRTGGVGLSAVPGALGKYTGRFEPAEPGRCELTVAAFVDGAQVGETTVAFEVGREDVEMRRLDLDEDALRRLASTSGGEYVPLVDFPSFAARLARTGTVEKTVELVNLRQKKVLYPLFIAFVALVTVEWFWRKRLQLP